MKFWYRMMVVVMAAAATFCTTALVCLEMDLWFAGEEQKMVCDENLLHWNSALYKGTGTLEGGVLKQLVIERMSAALSSER